MLKKILMTLLTLVIFCQQTAFAGSGLSEAIDELQYALTVEWDQKDQKFYEESIQKFQNKLTVLEAQGQDRTQMFEEVMSKIKNETLKKDMRLMSSLLVTKIMSEKEAVKFVQESMKKSYSQGASWSSEVWLSIGVSVVVVAFLTFWVIGVSKCMDDPNSTTSCSSSVTCYDGDGCYEEVVCGCSN